MPRRSSRTRGPHVTVTWFGHSAFLLTSPGGRSILIDPWLENPRAPANAAAIAPVHAILVTHGHADHLGNTIAIAARTGAPVYAIHEVSLYLKKHGVTQAIGMNKGGSTVLDGITFTMTDAKHSSAIDVDESPVPGGEAAGFVVRFENGFTVYHAGDTTVFSDMQLIGQLYAPDVALLPIGGLYTMGPREAALACTLLKPAKAIIGMHYGTFPPLAGTPAELRKLLPPRMRTRVRELVPGQPVEL